ncbi:MAG TPA: class I SAM-dependent methyltransferase [Phycisphaerae bacterium]|nr:class I SAM-dependent methyltransferase [Phycisphaerae bacterium]
MDHIRPTTRRYMDEPGIALKYDRYFADNPLFVFDSVLLERWLSRRERVLDLGCGTGRHLVHLARMGMWAAGVDLSRHMLRTAGEKLVRLDLPKRLVRADLLGVGSLFRPGSFDHAICMFSTLGLIAGRENRLRFVRDVCGLLRPGGLFVVHVHNRRHNFLTAEGLAAMFSSAIRFALGRGEWGDKVLSSYRGIRKMCIHVFSRREIVELLSAAGLEVIEVVHLNRRRDGRLRGRVAASWRANGFVVRARKPSDEPFADELVRARGDRPGGAESSPAPT